MKIAEHPSIILYGMAGSGITTLGEGLAGYLGYDFVDTDTLIENTYGMSRSELLARGIFEAIEQNVVLGYEPNQPTVIATGDSTARQPELVTHLGHFGLGVLIQPSAAELLRRLPKEPIDILENPDNLSFAALYAARMAQYRQIVRAILEVNDNEPIEQSLNNLKDLVHRLVYTSLAYD